VVDDLREDVRMNTRRQGWRLSFNPLTIREASMDKGQSQQVTVLRSNAVRHIEDDQGGEVFHCIVVIVLNLRAF
jgi:hypothetical protein